MRQRHVPGMFAVAYRGDRAHPDLAARLAAEGLEATIADYEQATIATWGLRGDQLPSAERPLLLSTTNWGDDGSVAPRTIARWLDDGALGDLGALLPPFGALGITQTGLRVAADSMGFRQLFKASGDGWCAVSTSARLLAVFSGATLDEEAVMLQSQLGWQLGQRTFFQGVIKLAPGEAVHLSGGTGNSELAPEPTPKPGSLSLTDGVQRATQLLRDFLEQYLDEVTDPTLQLTGGQDSRLLLSAIPRKRRRGLKVMTLDAPGTRDAEVAAALATRYGMKHTVRSLDGLGNLSPDAWFERVWDQASLHDCMADPIAHAGTALAEESFEQGHRISGLGGELGRGFYYTGRVRPCRVTVARAERLARWRMFANEPVEPTALAPRLRDQALPLALDFAQAALHAAGQEWYAATDELYYRHRMQRWAGLGETVVSFERTLTNPMLDHRFREIVRALSPRDKQDSRFLGMLQLSLDDELARIPLDDRPPPIVYARPNPVGLLRQRLVYAQKLARKVRQRVQGSHRPPPGGTIISTRILEYLREHPATLKPVRDSGLFDEEWLEGIAKGSTGAAPSSLALLTNTLVALSAGNRETL